MNEMGKEHGVLAWSLQNNPHILQAWVNSNKEMLLWE